MQELFELEWMGGAAEHHFRRARPGIEELPWGTLDTSDYPPEIVDAARASWTESAYTEYRAVAAFAAVLRAMCEAKVPLDVVGMASSFVADEVVHVELASRVAAELGGGVARPVDFEQLCAYPSPELTPFQRANELVLRVSCVAEAFSGKMAVSSLRATAHPLTRAVYERIVADESLHYRLGGVYFDWAEAELDDAERARLAVVAQQALQGLGVVRRRRPAATPDPHQAARRRATPEQIATLGWVPASSFAPDVAAAVRDGIAAPLAARGIVIPEEFLASLLA
ncbi:MAG TPA: hypothetical protein PLR99_01930 [Polyangiaceae bacterium]|nr:hypothetical protein [Polyangiaceae bacterium]